LRDSVVGRDLLVGLVVSVAFSALLCLRQFLILRNGEATSWVVLGGLNGVRRAVGQLSGGLIEAISLILLATFLLALLHALLRRDWLALAAIVAIISPIQ